jgi:hypothetical protein
LREAVIFSCRFHFSDNAWCIARAGEWSMWATHLNLALKQVRYAVRMYRSCKESFTMTQGIPREDEPKPNAAATSPDDALTTPPTVEEKTGETVDTETAPTEHVAPPAAPATNAPSRAEQLQQIDEMRKQGKLTEEQYQAEKQKILSRG